MVRAKFRLDSITRQKSTRYVDGKSEPCEVQTLRLYPVSGSSDENKKFFASTPSGQIELGTVNAEAVAQFQLGGEYYVDFTPVS